jgi:hypothetical protein
VIEEDRRRLHAGQAWFAQRGSKGIPMEKVLAEFGLKPEDFPPEDTQQCRLTAVTREILI